MGFLGVGTSSLVAYSLGLGGSVVIQHHHGYIYQRRHMGPRLCCWRGYSRYQAKRSHHTIYLWLFTVLLTPFVTRHPTGALAKSGRPLPPTPVQLQGKLLYRTTQPVGSWVLWSQDLQLGNDEYYLLPRQPLDANTGIALPVGYKLNLTCYPSATDPLHCNDITNATIMQSSGPRLNVEIVLRLLVMVVDFSGSDMCDSLPGANVTEVLKAFTDANGYLDFFSTCSYNKMVFNRTALKVVPMSVPCNGFRYNCDNQLETITTAAEQNLPGDVKLSTFTHKMYVVPNVTGCVWPGLADMMGMRTWFLPRIEGIYSKGIVMQELLHNFGIFHGWRGEVEYADDSSSMGSGNSCPSAPELWRLGWATPLAQLNTSTFPANLYRSFVLPATYLGPKDVMIKIQPDWLGGNYSTSGRSELAFFRSSGASAIDSPVQLRGLQAMPLLEILDLPISFSYGVAGVVRLG